MISTEPVIQLETLPEILNLTIKATKVHQLTARGKTAGNILVTVSPLPEWAGWLLVSRRNPLVEKRTEQGLLESTYQQNCSFLHAPHSSLWFLTTPLLWFPLTKLS